MVRSVGKPSKVDRKIVISVITKYKEQIILPNKKLVSKLDAVWGLISKDLNNELKASTLYSLVCKKDVWKQIFPSKTIIDDTRLGDTSVGDSLTSANDSKNQNDSSVRLSTGPTKLTIWATKSEFNELLEEKIYKRHEAARGKEYDRLVTVLTPGLWEEWVSDLIYDADKGSCAYNFRYAKVIQDGTSGTITGKCKCKGTLKCKIVQTDATPDKIRLDCTITKGKGKCGTRPLRAPIRQRLGKEMCTKSAVVWRAEMANKRMRPGDPEPPTLYTQRALNNAKYEYELSQCLDPDPIRALLIMKLELMQGVIHSIGLDPFFVRYWSSHQLHVYTDYAKQEPACIYVDATGGILRPITKLNGTTGSHLFLYIVVVRTKHGQFIASQAIHERQTAICIADWLIEWATAAGIHPKEFVCDSSKALLIAAIRSYTGHATIEEYANACNNRVLPSCYVRIDVAHFIKMYANLLKNLPKRIEIFYLAVLGQFVQVRNIRDAKTMLKSLFTLARSETDGNLPCGKLTQCEIHRNLLKAEIDPSADSDDEANDSPADIQPGLDSIFNDNNDDTSNFWHSWGKEIDLEVRNALVGHKGDRDNAHYSPKFADRLLNDIRWFPLWSCVYRDRFGYGRVPASSASVESEFNAIKTHLLRNITGPLRVDTFIEKHIEFINGRTKIIDAQTMSSTAENPDTLDNIAAISSRDSNVQEVVDTGNVDKSLSEVVQAVTEKDSTTENISDKIDITSHGTIDNLVLKVPQAVVVEDCVVTNISSGPLDITPSDEFAQQLPEFRKADNDTPNMFRTSLDITPTGPIAESFPRFCQAVVKTETENTGSIVCAYASALPSQPMEKKRKKRGLQSCVLCSATLKFNASDAEKEGPKVCLECKRLDSTAKVLASREFEGWGGFPLEPKKQRSRYIRKNHRTFDAISNDGLSRIPMMKNGNSATLKASKFGIGKYSFTKTCALDSAMNAILVAAFDRPQVEEAVNDLKGKNRLLNLVTDILDHGVRANSYRLRAEILIDVHRTVKSTGSNHLIDCETNVCQVFSVTFKDTPSVQEISPCVNGCNYVTKSLRTINVKREYLLDPEKFRNILHHVFDNRRGYCGKCKAPTVHQITATGPFLIMEMDDDVGPVTLKEIPKSFPDPLTSGKCHFKLIGIVDFTAPISITRSGGNIRPVGHYTTISLRPPDAYFRFDDTKP